MNILKDNAWCPVCGKDLKELDRVIGPEHTRMFFTHSDDRDWMDACLVQGSHVDMDRLHGRLHKTKEELTGLFFR